MRGTMAGLRRVTWCVSMALAQIRSRQRSVAWLRSVCSCATGEVALRGTHCCSDADSFRHLSPSIALKRDFSTVFLTVNLAALDNKLIAFRCLRAPETIEWE